jgi:ABC-type oligopeptide transport system substrate-binding subunit
MKDGINAILADPAATKPNATLTIDVVALEWADYLYRLQHKQLPIFFTGWAPDYADPDDYVIPFIASNGVYANRIGLKGSAGWNSTVVDGWISAAAQSLNSTERTTLYGKIQQAIVNQAAYIWTCQAQSFHVEAASMNGFQFNPMHDMYFYHYWKNGTATTTTTTTTTTTSTTATTTTTSTTTEVPEWALISAIVTFGSIAVIVVFVVAIVCRRK